MRKLDCSNCGHTTVQGSSQVFRKFLFHFCPLCWLQRREVCNDHMRRVAGVAKA
jgi:hypothetical protein